LSRGTRFAGRPLWTSLPSELKEAATEQAPVGAVSAFLIDKSHKRPDLADLVEAGQMLEAERTRQWLRLNY
jgi:hypothetical protein